MFDSLILQLATLGPIGKKLPAPGTFGSLAGIVFFGLLANGLQFEAQFITILFIPLILIGVPICSQAERILGLEDPNTVVWDEFSVIPLIFVFLPDHLLQSSFLSCLIWLSLGFLLFRFFDVLKPLGIKNLQKLPGGLGVMADDLAAALASAVILSAAHTFSLSFF